MADILIIDDQDRYAALCRQAIPEHRYRGPVRSWKEALDVLSRARGRVELVLLDVHFDIPDEDLLGIRDDMSSVDREALRRRQGLEILAALRARYPDLPVILMTSREELELGPRADALAAEEYTYLLDDDMVDARSLNAQIAGVLASRRGEDADGPVFWGRSVAMRRIRQRLSILARGRLPVVLLGPTGTGKSLLARHYVHERSGRAGRFVAVDLSTVPGDLIASHLFGAVKGSYTGSIADRTGAFEEANNGTLFLDEVGNLSLDVQKMLLSVLQEGVVTRLGDLRERPVDVKLVVATNENLAESVKKGTFRADLFMRLNPSTALRLPTLRERSVDFDRFLQFCLNQALERPYLRGLVEDYRDTQRLSAGRIRVHSRGPIPPSEVGVLVFLFPERSMRLLKGYPWPGNLREFAMVVENAVLFALTEMSAVVGGERTDLIQVRPKLIRDLLQVAAPATTADDGDGLTFVVNLSSEDSLNKVSVACERQYFTALYLRHRGDFGAMASVLLGGEEHARKVQLRFNQLGLKVRELKHRLEG
jgi:DNA-binding NtrC family response regulator